MAFYTIDFSVTADAVTPDTPQSAGHSGDHKAAVVRFQVPFEGYRYRLEITDGNGGYDTTGLLDAEDGTVSYEVPCAWTAAGIATLRLVAVEQEDGAEIVRFHSAPAYLHFADREDGEPLGDSARPAWQETLDEAQFFLSTVEQKLENGELKGDKGDTGDAGYTPQKGVDYYTDAEKQELIDELGERDVDQELDDTSSRAVANKVVCTRIAQLDNECESRILAVSADSTYQFNRLSQLVNDAQEGTDAAHTRITDMDDRLSSVEVAVKDDIPSSINELETRVGDIEAALDGIITIQESLIGGGTE